MAEPTLQEVCGAVQRSNINKAWVPFIVRAVQEYFKVLNVAYAYRKSNKLTANAPDVISPIVEPVKKTTKVKVA